MSLKPASINNSSVLAVVKDVDSPVTGVDVQALARNVRNRLGAHPACTRKIEEILTKLIKGHFIVHQDSVARATTHQERLDIIKAERDKIKERVTMTRHQRARHNAHWAAKRPLKLALPDDKATITVDQDISSETIDETPDVYIPAAWSDFGPDTSPWDADLLSACLPSERVLVSA